jgi:hypothetical protein
MVNLILFILISFGLTAIIVDGKIFDSIRPKWQFLKCKQCTGFWCSLGIFLIFWFFGHIKLFPNIYVGCFLFGCLGSGTSYILGCLFDDYGLRIEKTVNKDN